jgi:hypothetical protein
MAIQTITVKYSANAEEKHPKAKGQGHDELQEVPDNERDDKGFRVPKLILELLEGRSILAPPISYIQL